MAQPHSVTIDDQTYNVYRCDPETGLSLVARLTKLAGPAVAVAASARSAAQSETATDALIDTTIIEAARALAAQIEAPEVVRLVKDLLAMVEVVGQGKASEVFNSHFVGRYGAIFQLCGEVIKHNGFFGSIANLSGALSL